MWKSVSALLLLTLMVGVETAEAGKKRVGTPLKYMRPAAFEELPESIVRNLESRKCMIPQYPKAWTATDRINLVRGEFAKAGQNDWSVICADATDETLLVFWNGTDKDPAEIALGPRDTYLVTAKVPKETIAQTYAAQMKGVTPDHDAIGVTGNDNQTVVHYFHDGKWMDLHPAARP